MKPLQVTIDINKLSPTIFIARSIMRELFLVGLRNLDP